MHNLTPSNSCQLFSLFCSHCDLTEKTREFNDFLIQIIFQPGNDSGCTAVVALLVGRELYVANAGDSRCVVCRDGKAIEMSYDHKPEDEIERTRINKAGGRVTQDGRVNGGNFEKKKIVNW